MTEARVSQTAFATARGLALGDRRARRQRRHRQRGVPAARRRGGAPRTGEPVGCSRSRRGRGPAGSLLRRGRQSLRQARRRLRLHARGVRRVRGVRGRVDDVARAHRIGRVALERVRAGARVPLARRDRRHDASARDRRPAGAPDLDQRRGREIRRADRGVPLDRQGPAARVPDHRRAARRSTRARSSRSRLPARTCWGRRRSCSCSPTPDSRTRPRRRGSTRTRNATSRSRSSR